MLTERNIKILKHLIDSNESISIKYLAEIFNLSERSIRYDIDNINYILSHHQLPEIKRNSGGILVLDKISLVKEYLESLTSFQYSLEIRSKLLLYQIALNGEINIASVSRELDLSRSSIKADIEKIKPMLDSYDLVLNTSHKRGLTLQGDEFKVRSLQLNILLDFLTVSEIEYLVVNDTIEAFIGSIDTSIIDDFIYEVEKATNNIITDKAYQILKYYILITIIRIQKNKALIPTVYEENLIYTDDFKSIENQKKLLEDFFTIKLDNQELLQITSIYIGSPSFNFPETYYENWFETEVLVIKLIKKFSLLFGLDLTKDKELIRDLITFMKPTLYEMNSTHQIHDSSISGENIPYPAVHSILLRLLNDFTFSALKKLSKNRIAQLVNYFKASIDRNNSNLRINKNILLVSELGYDKSILLSQQLTHHYDINIIDTIPLHYVNNYKGIDDFDVIITTINHKFSETTKPIIKVNPTLTDEDFINLDRLHLPKSINKIRLSKLIKLIQSNAKLKEFIHVSDLLKSTMGNNLINDLVSKKKGLEDMLNPDNVRVKIECTYWEQAIRIAGQMMLTSEYIKPSYIDSMVSVFNEYGIYMIIKDGIAIPHAKNNNDILQTGFALLLLDQPVMTPFNKEISILFAFSSYDNTEHLEALSEFANLLTNTDFIKEANQFNTPEDILSFISMNKHQL